MAREKDPWKGFGSFLKGMPEKKQPKTKKKQRRTLTAKQIAACKQCNVPNNKRGPDTCGYCTSYPF